MTISSTVPRKPPCFSHYIKWEALYSVFSLGISSQTETDDIAGFVRHPVEQKLQEGLHFMEPVAQTPVISDSLSGSPGTINSS